MLSMPTSNGGVYVSGSSSATGDVASCSISQGVLDCSGKSFPSVDFFAASFVPYANKIVYVGAYASHVSATVLDVVTSTVQSYTYTVFNLKSVVLSQAQSPPFFLGSFVAGTAVRSAGTPVNYIAAGIVRSGSGMMSGMTLFPASANIINNADLVTSMTLESTGPDSFIAGSLELSDGVGGNAYVLRTNSLYATIQHCVRYRASSGATFRLRRALSTTDVQRSVVRGVALVDTVLYLLIDRSRANISALTVLKTAANDGAILQQVHVTLPGASLPCSGIVSMGLSLVIACAAEYDTTHSESLLLSMNRNMAFSALPTDFVRSYNNTFRAEPVPFQKSAMQVATTAANVANTPIEFTTANNGPTRRPSAAPTTAPSRQPSSAPSAQPTSSPTSSPTRSARPTSQPSTARPMGSSIPQAKPTVSPTSLPTTAPTVPPTRRPTCLPTLLPTVQPTARPSAAPSALPTLRPTRPPSAGPTRIPSLAVTRQPSRTPTMAPSIAQSGTEADANARQSDDDETTMTTVGTSIGGVGCICACLYALYWVYSRAAQSDARANRRVEYFAEQEKLVAAAEREREIIMQQERVLMAERQQRKEEREQQRRTQLHASFAFVPSQHDSPGQPAPVVSHSIHEAVAASQLSRASSTSSLNISSMHSSELDLRDADVKTSEV